MKLVYTVTVEVDDAWVARHPQYTPEFLTHQTECRLSDALRYDFAYEKVTVKGGVADAPKVE